MLHRLKAPSQKMCGARLSLRGSLTCFFTPCLRKALQVAVVVVVVQAGDSHAHSLNTG